MAEIRRGSIYLFTNKINNKQYIGSTIVDPLRRKSQHLYNAYHKENGKYNYPLYTAIRKYGEENFSFEVIYQKECQETEIRKIEKEYIEKYNTLSPNGYNQTLNTDHPLNDPETYKKMKETKRENSKNVAEINEKNEIIKIYRSIVDCSEETGLDKKKISACCRGERKTTGNRRFCWVDENYNPLIPEYNTNNYKGKYGIGQKQKTNRKVEKINSETNEIIEIYDSIAIASRANSCDASGISKVCRGVYKTCKGFKWRFADEQ